MGWSKFILPALRGVDERPRAEHQVGDDRLATPPPVGVHPPLVRIDVVVGSELAPFAAERGFVGEIDSFLHPDRPRRATVGDLGQRGRRQRRQLRRRREVIPLVERLEDRHQHLEGRVVGITLRVERIDIRRSKVQDFRGIGGGGGGGKRERARSEERDE
jgi:hypothetical protein